MGMPRVASSLKKMAASRRSQPIFDGWTTPFSLMSPCASIWLTMEQGNAVVRPMAVVSVSGSYDSVSLLHRKPNARTGRHQRERRRPPVENRMGRTTRRRFLQRTRHAKHPHQGINNPFTRLEPFIHIGVPRARTHPKVGFQRNQQNKWKLYCP